MSEFQSTQMLALILGAHDFPESPRLAPNSSFFNSASDVFKYLRDKGGLAVPEPNIHWLFDDCRSPSEQLKDIGSFIHRRTHELKGKGLQVKDLLLYYVGHGLFSDQTYCFAVRSTNENNEGASSIRAVDLAKEIKRNATFRRHFLIIDCCFSAAIIKEFQSGPLQVARIKLQEGFPQRGTAILCSSNARDASRAPEGLDHTMFSDALISVLRQGHPNLGPRFSISELADLVREHLRNEYDEWVRPEVHSPDQSEGDIANIPMFPNPAHESPAERRDAQKARIAEDERRKRAETNRQAEQREPLDRGINKVPFANEKVGSDRLANLSGTGDEIAQPQPRIDEGRRAVLEDLIAQTEIFLQYSLSDKALQRLQKIAAMFPGEEHYNARLKNLYQVANWWPPGASKRK